MALRGRRDGQPIRGRIRPDSRGGQSGILIFIVIGESLCASIAKRRNNAIVLYGSGVAGGFRLVQCALLAGARLIWLFGQRACDARIVRPFGNMPPASNYRLVGSGWRRGPFALDRCWW